MMEGSGLTISQPEPEFLLTISDNNSRELVRIKPDGTVIISEPGAEVEAAELFWAAIEVNGRGLHAARTMIATLRKYLSEICAEAQSDDGSVTLCGLIADKAILESQ